MSPDPFQNFDPAQTVKVLPRYLAGPGSVDPRTVWAFPFDEGWPFHQAEEGTAAAFSPCLRLWTTFDPRPDKPGKGTWTIGANRVPFGSAAWQITFDATTPVELLRDVHAELRDVYLEDRYSDQDRLFDRATAPHEAYAPLFARGWSHDVRTSGTQTFFAPERPGSVRHRYTIGGSGPTWTAWAGSSSEPYWAARFSFGTPTTLVAAFTASLISTEPVHRTAKDVPFHTRQHLYIATATAQQPPGHHSPAAPPPAGPRPGPGRTR